jgi:hypothetical protein
MFKYLWTSVDSITKAFKVSRKTIRKRLGACPDVRTLRCTVEAKWGIDNGKFFVLTEDIEKLNLSTGSKREIHASRKLQKENI